MMSSAAYEQKLLDAWEEVSKKAQLTTWILVALSDGPKQMKEIKEFMYRHTKGLFTADDKSLYRSLRRYNEAGMITFSTRSNQSGPDIKIYRIENIGQQLLEKFIKRNLEPIIKTHQTLARGSR